MYAVRYSTTRRPHVHCEEGLSPTEAQSRCSRRDAHSTPVDRRFQIHQEPFQPAFCRADNPENALAEHIIMSFKTKAPQTQLLAFYNNQWLNIPFHSIDTAFVFPLTHDIADELDRVGGEILGGVNRSKTFRVMVAYLALVHKLKNQTQTTPA
jgi:hypothetical protein